ncbi:MAG: glucosaminidase domain-containing protein [Salinivirgaceae bacterium]|nr:glucosaminidase domain-containing protein [Salinivirgaceae bacterium]
MPYKSLLIISLILFSVATFGQAKLTREDYINRYSDMAIREMKRSGVPASITLAQGMLESDNGNSTLAAKANNHFGIKCHNDWNGGTYYHDDDRPNECFRKYKTAEGSYVDHSDFLTQHQRYAFLFEYETTDYKSWAKGLKQAGYATNKNYAELLIKIIEDNELYRFDDKNYHKKLIVKKKRTGKEPADEEGSINPFGNDVMAYNRIEYVISKEGDTYESVAERHKVMPWQIYKYNELTKDSVLIPGTRLYLQPKRRKAAVEDKFHVLQDGENMYEISQQFGMKLKHLYRLNRMQPGTEPNVGTRLSLRKKVRIG